jgi:hypothetical protein
MCLLASLFRYIFRYIYIFLLH